MVGFLTSRAPGEYLNLPAAFRQGLKETGYVEGQNVVIESRFAENHYDRLPALAADLVRRQVSVIVSGGSPTAPVAKAATTTIPIIFITSDDPVKIGLVASLNRPGGNLTGVTTLNLEVAPKRLELLDELIPKGALIGVLINPTRPYAESDTREMQSAARSLGRQIRVLHASTEQEIETAFATSRQLQAGGLVIGADPFFTSHNDQIAALCIRHAVPTIFLYREFVAAGGLMSYGSSTPEAYRLAGISTGRILKGEKPADLPVQQATRVELIINMKTAKTLGLTFPTAILVRADEVIE
jgi:putative ABC transport system substrate-binding protein